MGNVEMVEMVLRNSVHEGDEINGYTFISKLGSGGFGTVWKVSKDDKELAIKIIPFTDRTGEKEQIFADVLKLRSPFLVRYIESFKTERLTFIVMELCLQGDLSGLVEKLDGDKGIGLQTPRLVKIFTQLALGVNELHKHKILHRDLKLQNVFVDSNDNVKLGDFGCASFLERMDSLSDTIIGTPHYMCPELYKRQQYGRGCDMWALGVIMYALATLRMPFSSFAPFPGTDLTASAADIVRSTRNLGSSSSLTGSASLSAASTSSKAKSIAGSTSTARAAAVEEESEEESESRKRDRILEHNVKNGELTPIQKYLYPDEITAVIHKLLNKDPNQRPSTDDILDLPIFREFAIQSNLIRYFPHDVRPNPKGGSTLKHTPDGQECVFTVDDYRTLVLCNDPIAFGVWRWTVKIQYAKSGTSTFRLGILPLSTAATADETYIGHTSGNKGICLLFEKAGNTYTTALHGVPNLPDAARHLDAVPDGATVAIEIDVEGHTLCFFVNDKKLRGGVSGISGPVYTAVSGQGKPSFTSVSYRRLLKCTPPSVTLYPLTPGSPSASPPPAMVSSILRFADSDDSFRPPSPPAGSKSPSSPSATRKGTAGAGAGSPNLTNSAKTKTKTSLPPPPKKVANQSQTKVPSTPPGPAKAAKPSRVANRQLELSDDKGQFRLFSEMCCYCARPIKKTLLPPDSCRLDCKKCIVSFVLNSRTAKFEETDFEKNE